MTEEQIKEIAYIAWHGAANAFRLYPDNKHTFVDYWATAKELFDKRFAPKNTEEETGPIALQKENTEWKEECDRLAGLVEFWQKKYYEINPPQQFGKIDNSPFA